MSNALNTILFTYQNDENHLSSNVQCYTMKFSSQNELNDETFFTSNKKKKKAEGKVGAQCWEKWRRGERQKLMHFFLLILSNRG